VRIHHLPCPFAGGPHTSPSPSLPSRPLPQLYSAHVQSLAAAIVKSKHHYVKRALESGGVRKDLFPSPGEGGPDFPPLDNLDPALLEPLIDHHEGILNAAAGPAADGDAAIRIGEVVRHKTPEAAPLAAGQGAGGGAAAAAAPPAAASSTSGVPAASNIVPGILFEPIPEDVKSMVSVMVDGLPALHLTPHTDSAPPIPSVSSTPPPSPSLSPAQYRRLATFYNYVKQEAFNASLATDCLARAVLKCPDGACRNDFSEREERFVAATLKYKNDMEAEDAARLAGGDSIIEHDERTFQRDLTSFTLAEMKSRIEGYAAAMAARAPAAAVAQASSSSSSSSSSSPGVPPFPELSPMSVTAHRAAIAAASTSAVSFPLGGMQGIDTAGAAVLAAAAASSSSAAAARVPGFSSVPTASAPQRRRPEVNAANHDVDMNAVAALTRDLAPAAGPAPARGGGGASASAAGAGGGGGGASSASTSALTFGAAPAKKSGRKGRGGQSAAAATEGV
jgi:hypothetical protein